jgi:hypothetical protein
MCLKISKWTSNFKFLGCSDVQNYANTMENFLNSDLKHPEIVIKLTPQIDTSPREALEVLGDERTD